MSTTPLVIGEAESEEGIIIERVPLGLRLGVADGTRSFAPSTEIQIFDGEGCVGPVIGAGTAEVFEGEGIGVEVTPNAETILSADRVGEPSACSNPFSYWEGNVPTEETSSGGGSSGGGSENGGSGQGSSGTSSGGAIGPAIPAGGRPDAPHIHTNPSDRANDLTPLIAGSAQGANTVAIYSTSNCGGMPIATGAASQLSSGFEVAVAENAATTFSAVAIGSQHSTCSSPVTYTEDSTPPRTRITMGPGVKTRKRKAIFRFKDVTEDPPGTTFRCKVDKAKWKPCSSPFHLKHLKLGHHIVAIRATDLAGNVERKPVKRRFIVVLGTKS